MNRILMFFLGMNTAVVFSQSALTIEGTVVNNSITGDWSGVNIQRSVPTVFIYRNNSVTSQNLSGYMLQAGDELPGITGNNLQGEIITGNRFTWNGSDLSSITHGIFTGYNRNAVIRYNYLNKVPMGIIRKSDGMTNTSGGVAYNIINNPVATGVVVKGMNNVNIYNNTFYSNRAMYDDAGNGTWRGLVHIYSNDSPVAASTGTRIMNNIFYTKNQIYNITIADAACAGGFESDYNIFYCESGTPMFNYLGTPKTFAQWQELGFDLHSVVKNPGFIDFTSFVPASRLDYGVSLGPEWQAGLSSSAAWVAGSPPSTADQNGKWQVGARVHGATSASVTCTGAVIGNASPASLILTFSASLANVIPAASSFGVKINNVTITVRTVAVSGSKVTLLLAEPASKGDAITVSYTKPSANQLQSSSGELASSFPGRAVTNNVSSLPIQADEVKMTIYPNPVHNIVNIKIEPADPSAGQDAAGSTGVIRIYDISGSLQIERMVDPGVTETQIPVNLKTGIYIVQLFSGSSHLASQKIIVY